MRSRSPLRGCKGNEAPVSARKLAAMMWEREMNEIPSPCVKGRCDDTFMLKNKNNNERLARLIRSGSLPPHLSDPSHTSVSETRDRSGTGCYHRRNPPISIRLRHTDRRVGYSDSRSNASLEEVSNAEFHMIETRSRTHTPASSMMGVKTRLKDVSNALTTSQELLKIINRMCGQEDRPFSSLSLISALHTELETARMQINQLIQEQHSDQNEMCHLMKCFTEEKAAWKRKEIKIIEAAIESVMGELGVERKLRRRLESLNKKLGRELAETKASLRKKVKELEREKRAREIIEQVVDELARSADEDKFEIKRESTKVYERVDKEKEMIQLADMLREERSQMKLSQEKNAAINELRNQLETFLGNKKVGEKGCRTNNLNNQEIAAYLGRNQFGSHQNEDKEDGEVDNVAECEDDSAESDLHSIELNVEDNDNKKSYKWAHPSESRFNVKSYPIEEENKIRRSASGRVSRRSISLQRSISDGTERRISVEKFQNSGYGMHWESFSELEKQANAIDYDNEMKGYKSVKGLRNQTQVSSRTYASPTKYSKPWTSHLSNAFQESPATEQCNAIKPRLVKVKGEGQNVRKSKW
ncbi:hypothetical protein RJT34_31108 [Clitoria ternatea]|uniref:Uncharacterized protein n=1 Tax=Clitoria ternatea TaxID=43366 RepID=A0AAN9EU23_CLITE